MADLLLTFITVM